MTLKTIIFLRIINSGFVTLSSRMLSDHLLNSILKTERDREKYSGIIENINFPRCVLAIEANGWLLLAGTKFDIL